MIQRIQSVLLALALICSVTLFFIPVFQFQGTDPWPFYKLNVMNSVRVTQVEVQVLVTNWPLIVLNALIIIITLVTIFKYKERMKQARMCHFLFLLQLVLIVLIIFDRSTLLDVAGDGYVSHIQAGIAFLLLPLLLFPLSRHYIKKDEALVRSADRLR